jgi:hypothetical protein
MSISGLLSATFHEPGYCHLVELVHQRDLEARRHLASLRVAAYNPSGFLHRSVEVDPNLGVVDLAILLGPPAPEADRLFVIFDARYDPGLFPYRPHHYAYLHGDHSLRPPLYYAVNATMGGVPDRIGTTRFNHFETYLFLQRPLRQRSALMLGNPSRFATARAEVAAYYDVDRVEQAVELPPKAHAEVPLAAEHAGGRLRRVDLKAPFRLTSYVVGRDGISGDLVLFDHLFSYFK